MLFNREVGYLITLFFIDYDISIVDKIFFYVQKVQNVLQASLPVWC